VASVATPLLIHCLAQPTGANVFWELVENDFNSEDWKVRFSAGWCYIFGSVTVVSLS